jgi:hypothetical protein
MSAAGFYAWLVRPPSERAIRHAWLTDLATEVHVESRQTYGAIRVHAELTLGRGVQVGLHQMALVMRRAGLQGPWASAVDLGSCARTRSRSTSSTGLSHDPNETDCG